MRTKVLRKISSFLVLLVTLISCGTDELSPCEDNPEMKGLLCKEYRYENGTSIGYLSYFYNSQDQMVRTEYNSINGTTKKYVIFEYNDKNLVREASFSPDGNMLRETIYNYNNDNSLSDINHEENGASISRRIFEYQNTVLTKETELSNDQLDNYITYQYYSDDGKLYKKSYYNAQSQLTNYTTYEHFDNLKIRYNHYTANHNFTGYDVEHFNADNTPKEFVTYDTAGEIISTTKYDYNTLGLLNKSESLDSTETVISHILFLYY